jgi:predicted DsbA family dithiol-disulfide isomerase
MPRENHGASSGVSSRMPIAIAWDATAMEDLRSAPVPAVRDDDHVRGDGRLVVLYADLTCPHCAVAHERLRSEHARVVFRHLALKARHPRALALAHAAEAAAAQDAFWAFADATYGDQGHLEDPHLWERCEQLGLDVARFDADRRSEAVAARVRRDVRDALRAGATGTPWMLDL